MIRYISKIFGYRLLLLIYLLHNSRHLKTLPSSHFASVQLHEDVLYNYNNIIVNTMHILLFIYRRFVICFVNHWFNRRRGKSAGTVLWCQRVDLPLYLWPHRCHQRRTVTPAVTAAASSIYLSSCVSNLRHSGRHTPAKNGPVALCLTTGDLSSFPSDALHQYLLILAYSCSRPRRPSPITVSLRLVASTIYMHGFFITDMRYLSFLRREHVYKFLIMKDVRCRQVSQLHISFPNVL